jgi:predicted transcriptional regulator
MKVLLSIKPEYAEKILSGEKKYEFRRTLFKNASISKVIIYASSPIQKIIGEFDIDKLLSLDIDELWTKTEKHSGIEKDYYYEYFEGKDIAHAIKVKSTKRYRKAKELSSYNIVRPPQSFMYLAV